MISEVSENDNEMLRIPHFFIKLLVNFNGKL